MRVQNREQKLDYTINFMYTNVQSEKCLIISALSQLFETMKIFVTFSASCKMFSVPSSYSKLRLQQANIAGAI